MATSISTMSEILIHLLLIVVQDAEVKRTLSRNVKLIDLWAENPNQQIEGVFADILNSVINNLARR